MNNGNIDDLTARLDHHGHCLEGLLIQAKHTNRLLHQLLSLQQALAAHHLPAAHPALAPPQLPSDA